MSMKEDQVWLQFACAAIANFEPEDDLDTLEEVAEATADYAEAVADEMTEMYMEKFGDEDDDDKPRRPRATRPVRPARRAKKEEED